MAEGATIAVVGAGMAGAACARALIDAGHAVVVFDKGRDTGGRLAQRRAEGAVFDHGAQYMGAHDPAFVAAVDGWREAGLVAAWPGVTGGRGQPVWIGVPAMSAPVRHLLRGSDVRTGCEITALARGAAGWTLAEATGAGHGPYARLVLAIPAPQAAALLRTTGDAADAPALARLDGVRIAPCWSVLAAFHGRIEGVGDSLRRSDGALAWCARNSSKPGRGAVESWTLNATPSWSRQHLERQPAEVVAPLLDAFARLSGRALPLPRHLEAHRWRYAMVEEPLGLAVLHGPDVALCGDWCLGPRVEAAWLSGRAAAATL